MEEAKKSGEKILDLAGDMVENYRKLIAVKVVEHSSIAGAASVLGIILLVTVVFILLFAGIGFAWWLGEEMNNMKAGFFIIGGVYSIILIALLLISGNVLMPSLRNFIIKKIYEQD